MCRKRPEAVDIELSSLQKVSNNMSDARDCARKNSGGGGSDVERVMSRKVMVLDTSANASYD